ncbi:MAG: ISAs1 family transposase [Methylocella sp.]
MAQAHAAIRKYFRKPRDPRVRRRRRHLLLDIIAITICAAIGGCDDWQRVETFARGRHEWLRTFLRLPEGVPSHDTFERVFDRLDPEEFQACFRDWMRALHEALGLSRIAIDGKTLRGSGAGGLKALHLVSAWATAHCLSLGQVAVDEKSNEIPAIPQLLELLDLHGALVTIDAMGCQKAIAAKVVEGGGDYILTVKENQEGLLEDVRAAPNRACESDFAGPEHDTYETRERGHGREEYRCYTVPHDAAGIRQAADWAGLTTIGFCYGERTVDGVTGEELRYFIGSKKASAKVYGKGLRNHWGIENKPHWQLDVSFHEDKNRVNKRHGAENLSVVRRLALSLLKQHPNKRSLACKRLLAALDPTFLEEVLRGDSNLGKV